MTNYNDGNWHGWNGGECPVHPGTVVKYIWIGSVGITLEEEIAENVCWDGAGGGDYFLPSFRVIKEHKEPREFYAVRSLIGGDWREVTGEFKGAVLFREVIE